MREMKNSGVEWIGEIPAEWEITTIKKAYTFQTGWTPDTKKEDNFIGDNVWVNISDMNSKVIFDSNKHISDDAVAISSMNISPKGSLLYSFKLSVGNVAFCGVDLYTNEAIATFLEGENSLKYLYYIAPVFIIKNANENIYGAKLLNQSLIRNAKIVLPPLPEQHRIADYLDEKCAKIDAVIEKQKQVIEKLKEYKLSVITEAVTKGLDPTVPMKDSGVEWIGEVPCDAEVVSVSKIFKIVLGKMLSTKAVEDNETLEKYFCAANVHFDTIDYDNLKQMWFSDYEKNIYKVKKGDLLVVEGGAGAGGANVVSLDVEDCYIQNSIMIVRSLSYIRSKWLYYYLYSLVKRNYIDYVCNKATIPHFTKDKLSKTKIVVFSENETEIILKELDETVFKVDETITQKQSTINKLTEYKKSLIYEVVTGKKEV